MKFLTMFVLVIICSLMYKHHKTTDSYVRGRVFLLKSAKGSCTGVEVKGKSKHYILTAGHCRPLLIENKLDAVSEEGVITSVSFVAEDDKSDLMLLTAADSKTIDLAPAIYSRQPVHSMTHGYGRDSYRVDGETIQEELVNIPMEDTPVEDCITSKLKVMVTPFGPICVLHTITVVTTSWVVPGSSGGPMLDTSGRLVGIISAGDTHFSEIVPLYDIKKFLIAN